MKNLKVNEEVNEYDLASDPITITKEDSKKLGDILFMGGKPTSYMDFVKKLTGIDPNSVASGQEVIGDIDEKVFAILNMGLKDLDVDDEKIDINEVNTNVKDLYPTQSQIGLLDSLAFCAFKRPESANSYLAGDANFGGGRVISCDINGKKYILDGHHRWSGVYSINPDATVPCFELQLTGKVKNPVDALKMIQLAIAATFQHILLKGANSETDIFDKSKVGGDIKNLINNSFDGKYDFPKVDDTNKALSNLKGFIELLAADERFSENVELIDLSKYKNLPNVFNTDELQQKYSNVVSVLANNLNSLINNNGKPEDDIKRSAMPQPNDTSVKLKFGEDPEGIPDSVVDKIESGELNFLPNKEGEFIPDEVLAKESKKWIMTYEQFRHKK
jgi:hypothetical protein